VDISDKWIWAAPGGQFFVYTALRPLSLFNASIFKHMNDLRGYLQGQLSANHLITGMSIGGWINITRQQRI
jgi:hypothetical protein